MKILDILSDGPTELSTRFIELHKKGNDVKVIDLSKGEASYDKVIDEIAAADKVISW